VAEILRLNETAATAAELQRLETRLREAEQTLAAEVRRLSASTTTTGGTRRRRQALNLATLLARATALEANATAEIAALTAANRSAVAATLTRQVQQLEALVTEIQGLNATAPEAELRRLETRLADLESTVAAELRRLSQGTTGTLRFRRQAVTRASLLARAQALETRATTEIAALTAANRTSAAAGLQRQERELEALVAEITALPATAPEAELRRLETRLAELEALVAAELRALGVSGRFRRQAVTRESLIARGDALVARARTDVTALRTAGRTAEATRLEQELRVIETLVTDLRNLRTTALTEAELRVLENALNEAENRFEAELTRIEASSAF